MNCWGTYRRLICAYLITLVLMPVVLASCTPRMRGFSDYLIPLMCWFFGLVFIRLAIGIVRKEQKRFVTFYTVLLYSSLIWMPALIDLKFWLTSPSINKNPATVVLGWGPEEAVHIRWPPETKVRPGSILTFRCEVANCHREDILIYDEPDVFEVHLLYTVSPGQTPPTVIPGCMGKRGSGWERFKLLRGLNTVRRETQNTANFDGMRDDTMAVIGNNKTVELPGGNPLYSMINLQYHIRYYKVGDPHWYASSIATNIVVRYE